MIFWYLWIIKNRIRVALLNNLIHINCHIKGVKLGQKVIFNGFPFVLRFRRSRIEIGDNCSFNSAKSSLLIGLLRPCTFVTLAENSEIILGNNVGLSGCIIIAASKIILGNQVMIGANCTILDTDFHHSDLQKRHTDNSFPTRPVIIKDNVFIGANCLILKGITIGQNSTIGAGSVVITSIPDNTIAAGNPCKVIIRKSIESNSE
jgi:acetyltransferase-like isoleucine patch superfamily enzyme